MELTVKDKKILYELEKNARNSNSEIAKVVGLSKDAVGYRIKQLEKRGIIRGYRALIDATKLGYNLFRIYLQLIDISEKELQEMIEYLQQDKNSWWIGKLDGSWDFAFAYWAKDNLKVQDFLFEFSKRFSRHIKNKLICPILNYNEFPRKYLTESKIITKGKEKINEKSIDELDKKILKELSKNARKTIIELAGKFKVDSKTIINRIRKLEEQKIILGYKEDIDVSKLGRDFYTVEINLNDFTNFEQIRKEIHSLKELSAESISIGGYDIEFDLEISSTQEYYKIIDRLKNKFPEIREIRYFRVIENYKIVYMPEE
ncbi:Lrp/AsnC family transcriptional regulator [archaeon]|nr:Lrp/AsnC family transcriptional regulator [archaeon]